MQIDIQARHFSLTEALRNHAERRLRFSLTCFDGHIQRVVMRLSDINGPKGGVDKHCHLQVVLSGLPDVVIEDTEADMYVAINRAADRAGRTVERKISRQHTLLRHGYSQELLYEQLPGMQPEQVPEQQLEQPLKQSLEQSLEQQRPVSLDTLSQQNRGANYE